MEVRRCMKCMHDLSGGIAYCPECGRAYGSVHAEPFALKPGTILNGKYLMGEMLGQGGFGITYIGLDLLLQQKVAIKEYFPTCTGMVSRENRSTVVWSSAMVGKTGTQRGFDSFLKEARKMAKLGGIPNVVGVKSVFTQNETAYIVMDFIEGETLQQKMQKNGPMDFDSCIRLMTPIMQSLAEVHKHGMAALLQIVTRLQKGGKAEPVKPAPQAEPAKAQRTPPVPPRPADVKPPVKNAPPKTPQKKPLPAWLIPAVAGVVAVLGIVVCIVTATGKTPRQNVSMKAAATEPVLQPAPAETTPKTTTPKATVPKATEPKPEPTTKPTQPKNHIEYVDGYWESTNLKDGNFSLNVHALVFYTPLVRCREMTVNMEVSMNAGTKCKEWQVWLVCIEGATKGTDYRIHSQNNYIGRSARMDISIPGDPHISAENSAIIAYDNEDRTFYFGPCSGRNIVRVNGKPALSVEKIEAYDVLTVGTTKLLFVPLCGDRFDWNEKK